MAPSTTPARLRLVVPDPHYLTVQPRVCCSVHIVLGTTGLTPTSPGSRRPALSKRNKNKNPNDGVETTDTVLYATSSTLDLLVGRALRGVFATGSPDFVSRAKAQRAFSIAPSARDPPHRKPKRVHEGRVDWLSGDVSISYCKRRPVIFQPPPASSSLSPTSFDSNEPSWPKLRVGEGGDRLGGGNFGLMAVSRRHGAHSSQLTHKHTHTLSRSLSLLPSCCSALSLRPGMTNRPPTQIEQVRL